MLESTDSIVHAVWTRMNKYEISVSIVEHATSRRSQLPQQGKQLLASLVRGSPEPAGKPFVARDLRRSRWQQRAASLHSRTRKARDATSAAPFLVWAFPLSLRVLAVSYL
jgi:hypothetical protein